MKRYALLLLIFCILPLSHSKVFADPCCDETFCPDLYPEPKLFTFRSELIYFQPTIDQPHYVISAFDNFFHGNHYPIGTRHNNTVHYKPGYRLEGAYELWDYSGEIDLRFTSLQAGHANEVTGPVLFDTVGYPGDGGQAPEDTFYSGTARMKSSYRYYAGDFTFNRFCINCSPETFTILLGLHYAFVEFKQKFNSDGSFLDPAPIFISNELNTKSRFWGIGPELGADYHYHFYYNDCEAISLDASFRTALLFSDTVARFRYVTATRTGPLGVDLRNQHLTRVTPMLDARLGASYVFSWCDWEGTLEAGYEFLWYSNCIDSIVGYDVAFPGDTIDVYSSLSLQGPFLALSFRF